MARPKISKKQELPQGMPRTHAVLGQVVARLFSELRVSASLMDGIYWYAIHTLPNVVGLEVAHSVEQARWSYNYRSVAKVRREGRPVLGKHAGFFDLFVPVRNPKGPCGILVVGPFARKRPTSTEILARWHSVIGAPARPSDPEFLQYVSMTLATLTLDGPKFETFKRLVVRFAQLLEGSGHPDELFRETTKLRASLEDVRVTERMSEHVRDMVDERTTRGARGAAILPKLSPLGIERPPEHVLVGLTVDPNDDPDPLDLAIRRDAFQRAAAAMAVKRRATVCGQVGDHGVTLVSDETGPKARVRTKQRALAEQLRLVGKRLSLKVYVGICPPPVAASLPARYQAALSAAQRAISRGLLVVEAEAEPGAIQNPLRELRAQLVQGVREDPKLLRVRFERYASAVTAYAGYRIEPVRAYLEGAFDLVSDALGATGALGERSLRDLETSLRALAGRAGSIGELLQAYREVMRDVESALLRPSGVRQDRSLSRALDYIREHFGEALPLIAVARVAGFAPAYFSSLFAERQGITFQEHLRTLRMEHAKDMLAATPLSAERVGQLCGFRSRNRFYVAFKRTMGVTPADYRRRCEGPDQASLRKGRLVERRML